MKKRYLFVLLMVLILALPLGSVFANGGTVHVVSSWLHYSGTGWGGWSCPAGTVVINAGVQDNIYPVGESHVWKPGATTAGGVSYPNTPFGYTYTPPEEGYIVQNGGIGQSLRIWLDCAPPHDYSAVRKMQWDCDGWEIWASIRDYGVEISTESLAAGAWTDPYVQEVVVRLTDYAGWFTVTLPDGSTVRLRSPNSITEPAECQIFRTYKTHQAYLKDNCEGIFRVINLYEGPASDPYQTLVGTLYNETTLFTDPFTFETIPAVTVDVPVAYGADYTFAAMNEPAFCHEFTLNVIERSDCEGYYRKINLRDGGGWIKSLYMDQGPWTDPYTIEMLPGLTVPILAIYGGDVVFGDLYEPEECLVILEHHYKVKVKKNCDGYSTTVVSNDGGVATPLTPTSGVWVDPYTREMAVVTYEIVWPDGYTKTTSKKVWEPRKCLVVLEHDFLITGEADCDGWGFTASSSDGGVGVPLGPTSGAWLDLYALESASVSYEVTWPDGYVATLSDGVNEPERCLKGKKFSTKLANDCIGFGMVFSISEGGTLVLDAGVALSGAWLNPYKLEAAAVSGKIVWLDGSEDLFNYAVNEPAECFVCEVRDVYRQITLVDYDAEDWYYGRGSRNGSCWVLMTGEAEFAPGVAVFRQAEICSVCEYPDFIYEADRVLYDAYVTIDCNGKISYPDPLWDPEWFRSDYKELAGCRRPSCLNPLLKPSLPLLEP